jgi:Holliday junction resolvase RusA-like endonuclease
MFAFTIPGDPIPFARAGSNKGRRFTPKKQGDFMGVVKLFAQRAMAGKPPLEGPISVRVRAVYLTPASWSQKRKDAARWKTSKPDADNIVKILKDAMNTIVFRDDAQVAVLHVQKIYGPVAGVTVEVASLEGVSMWEGGL